MAFEWWVTREGFLTDFTCLNKPALIWVWKAARASEDAVVVLHFETQQPKQETNKVGGRALGVRRPLQLFVLLFLLLLPSDWQVKLTYPYQHCCNHNCHMGSAYLSIYLSNQKLWNMTNMIPFVLVFPHFSPSFPSVSSLCSVLCTPSLSSSHLLWSHTSDSTLFYKASISSSSLSSF